MKREDLKVPGRKQIVVIGGSSITDQERIIAEEVGSLIAGRGAILLSGGKGGVMEASCQGAVLKGGTTVGILPGTDGNSYLTIRIKTRLDQARNYVLVGSGDAVIAIGGEYGTLSEIAYALKSGIPVYGISTWDIPGVISCMTAEEAVNRAMEDT